MTQYQYTAFISYSHAADGRLAEVLQARLQRFATPWYRRRSIRVFRDKTGLGLTPDLWDSIRDALDASEYFVLLASERAAQSPWVEREVDTWLAKGAADRLLIVCTDGELYWDHASGDFDWTRTTCLPARLRGALQAEPLHLDMRWARSRTDLSPRRPELLDAIARLSATLRHQALDDLIGEDVRQQRRVRQLATAAVAALSILLMGALVAAGVAVQQRNRARQQERVAEQQRAVAEQRLVQSLVSNGLRLIDERDLSGAALWFADALALTRDDDSARQRLRVRTALEQHPRLRQVWVVPRPEYRQWITFGRNDRYLLSGMPSDDTPSPASQPWDPRSGTAVKLELPAAEHRLLALDASAKSIRAVLADGEGAVRVWDGLHGVELAPLPHPAEVLSAEFDASGQVVVTSATDGVARLWEPLSGRLLRSVEHSGELVAASLTRDRQRLLSFTADNAIHIWTLGADESNHMTIEHDEPVQSIDVSADGARAVTLDGTWSARIWNLSGESARLMEAWDGVEYAEFNPDGSRLVLAFRGGEATVFASSEMREEVTVRHEGAVLHAIFSADGSRLATASTDSTARIWDARSGKPWSPPLYHEDTVSNLAFGADSTRLASVTANGTVRVWELAVAAARYAHASVEVGEFSADGRRLLTRSDGLVRLWDVKSGDAVTLHDDAQVYHAAFSPDGRQIVIGSENGTAQILDAVSGAEVRRLRHGRRVNLAAYHPDGRRIATAGRADDGRYGVALWELSSGTRLFDLAHDSPVTQMEFSADGRRLLTRYFDGEVRAWDIEQKKGTPVLTRKECRAATLSPDGRRIAIIDEQYTVAILDASSGRALVSGLRNDDYRIRKIAFAPHARSLLILSEGSARIYDAESGAPLTPLLAHDTPGMLHAAFSGNGAHLLTVSVDGNVMVRDANTGLALTPPLPHPGRASYAAFARDGSHLLTVGGDEARLWDIGASGTAESDTQLARRARLLAARRIDATGAMIPLTAGEFHAAWKQRRQAPVRREP